MAISEMRRAFVPDLDPAVAAACGELWWPRERLAEAVEELARRSGLRRSSASEPLSPPPAGELDGWMTWAAARLELEAEAVDAAYPEADEMLQGAGPAILLHDEARGEGFFVVLGARGDRVRLLSPELMVRSLGRDVLRTALCWRLEAPLIPDVEATLDMASTAPRRRAAVRAALLRERLAEARVGGVWMLRLPATSGFWRQLQAAGAVRRFGLVLGVFALVYALEAWSWGLIGGGVLNGRLDFGWLIAWLMVVVTMTPWRLVGAWLEGTATVDTSRIVKSRLLAGALRMSLDGVARQGVGQLLGRVMEAQALESLTLGGGMAVLVASLEMVFAGWVLSKGVAPLAQIGSLIACGILILALSWRYHRRLAAWSQSRLDMTNTLIEGMVGHRTRLAQERPGRREAAEDAELQGYLEASRRMDDAGAVVLAGLPSAWMMLGLAGLVPAFVGGGAPSAAAMAISLGGLMIAQRSLSGMAGGLAALSRAVAAWDHAGPLFRAGRAGPETRPFTPVGESSLGGGPLLEAQGLTFRYPGGAEPAVRAADLTIGPGDRILLEGGSGGGKSTLAALVTGLREPDSGLMLLGGLDRHTLGDGWRRIAAYAPQFHDNHVLSGPLAFNLLMGRAWPPSAEDLAEAEAVCEDLGLGALLRRMPAGVMQPVGETGWQLSHGERSRIFLARALLQGAPLTAMDESFGALDPETMALCLRATLRRTRALMVVAHP